MTAPEEPASGVATANASCWSKIAGTPITNAVVHTFPASFSATFKTAWSPTALYVLAVVNKWPLDNAAPNVLWYKNDAIEFYVSGSNNRSGKYASVPGTAQIGLTAKNRIEDGTNAKSMTGLTSSVVTVPNTGYLAELIIPWSALQASPSAGKQLGFTVSVDVGNSQGVHRTAQVTWQGTSVNYSNDTLWGVLQLGS